MKDIVEKYIFKWANKIPTLCKFVCMCVWQDSCIHVIVHMYISQCVV